MHYTKTMKQKIMKEYQELKDESVDDFVKEKEQENQPYINGKMNINNQIITPLQQMLRKL